MIDSVGHPTPGPVPRWTARTYSILRNGFKLIGLGAASRCLLRRAALFLLVLLCALLSQQPAAQAQTNNPPRVEPVADREMYVGDEIQINLNASDPNEFDTVTFIEVPSLLPLPAGAELFPSGDGSAFILFAPTVAGVYSFAVVAVDDGTPQGRTALFFTVTVKEKPADFADLAIANVTLQSASVDGEVRVGDPFVYTIDVTNVTSATVAAADTTLTVILDGELSPQTGDDRCVVESRTVANARIRCDLGTVAPGTVHRVQLTVHPIEEGTAVNQLLVTTTTLDPITVNNDQPSSLEVEPTLIDLALTKELIGVGADGDVDVGDRVTVQVTVENKWSLPTNFTLVDTYSPGWKIHSVEGTGSAPCVVDGQQIRCEETIAAFRTVVYTVVAEVVQQGVQHAAGVLTGLHADPDTNNNRAAVQVSARAVGDLEVTVTIVDRQEIYYVGDLIAAVIHVEAINGTTPITFGNVTIAFSTSVGLSIFQVDAPADLNCLGGNHTVACTKQKLRSAEPIAIPLLLYAEVEGSAEVSALVYGSAYRDVDLNNNEHSWFLPIGKPPLSWVYIHSFDDRNGNGLQDPGEPALPDVKIDTTSSDGQESKIDQGDTDVRGVLKQPILEDASRLRVTAKVTLTQSITPVISVKLNAVPPTGQATITGGNDCLMTVGNNDGTTVTLPCSEEDTVEWENQVNASVADLTTKLLAFPSRALAANQQPLVPVTVTFEVIAAESQVIYLPMISK